ncbi:Transcriptional regulator [Ignavibacterium album JCM 16511]|uniref:Transcriptional regulator n=1 Tax=Ignavibacterium album (strain DSM 19864 / JCM 16511 / NBRC 101810 / Mat9-16) TaxID=945713 RepID=I0AN51_IGNAJ|nr:sigma-54-dependent Fis family transcriptional regulator [Ignavibacterium album]AFH50408.1 Transcriptional regulator [Ignavibacterium album JCM 16511]
MPAENKFNEEILNSIAEGVITVDKTFKVNFINRAAEEIMGYKKDEVIGQFCKYILKCDLCQTKCPIGIVLETGTNLYDYSSVIYDKNGNRKPIKLNAAILKNSEQNPVGGVISFRDVSELERIKQNSNVISNFFGIVGHGKAMQEIFRLIMEISESDATVLILGESGTGKELIANAIQATSTRKDKPFLKVNCSVFPQNLLASELFGHVKGAFTDAVKDRPGRFELADGGTIFLDEVAEMPLQTQIQLLRVLQEGTFERVGESITRKVDVRVIAATNIEIQKALKEGKLREDLYYRLNVIPISIPPLRERKEDIPHLVKHFIETYSKLYRKTIPDISDDGLELLMKYSWPGNVRELENVIEYAVVRTKNENLIEISNLPSSIKDSQTEQIPQRKIFRNENAASLLSVLEKHKWNKTKAAKELGIGRTTLWRMLRELEIES